ncbi:MarR family transcriptional regulator [Streptomyces sp. NPDC021020]|uniref:MarR family transcriptional regulator n=1 Tax=Streptomyces sp. NPDC021020 TaxID=3365109 RepID=UPI003794FE44
MADDQPLWGYREFARHLGTTVGAVRSRKSQGSLPEPDDTSVPDRPRWRPATFEDWKPVGRGYRTDFHGCPAHADPHAPAEQEPS